jgi:BirA family biotin operon repressor/biotin-[acetyl-CoA-carboxylase] ligase
MTVAGELGHPRLHFRVTDSTNARARELATRGAPHGTVVTAAEQSAGRGRHGRTWSAPAGRALLCSVVLRDPPPLLPLVAGVAVAERVGPEARIKWPNDVLVAGLKVAGILVEARLQEGWAVVGIGVNVAVARESLSPEVRERAGTLGLEPSAIEPWLGALLGSLEVWLGAGSELVLDAVRSRDALLGQEVRWAGGAGVGAGIDGDGRLVVRTEGGAVALDAGEVHLGGG